jgi:hypothetical protein
MWKSFRKRSQTGAPAAAALALAIVIMVEQRSVHAQTADICDGRTGQSAEEIFRRAQDRWASNVYPYDLHYVLTISATGAHDETIVRHYDGHAEPGRDVIFMNTRSEEEASAPPAISHGLRVIVELQGHVARVFKPKFDGYDIMGIPRLSPVYAFGMMPAASAATPPPATTDLHTIATVQARSRTYRVSCVESAVGEHGVALDHLLLEPLRDPNRNRIRELWIESGSYWTDRMLLSRNFVDGPPLQSPWDIAFVHDERAEYIRTERALKPLDYGRGREYRDVTLSFERTYPTPSAVTDFMFTGQGADDDGLVEP